MAERHADQDEEKAAVEILEVPKHLQEQFGLPKKLPADEFEAKMAEIKQVKYLQIPWVQEQTKLLAASYAQAVAEHGQQSEEAKEALEVLRQRVKKTLKAGVNDKHAIAKIQVHIKDNPEFEGFSFSTNDVDAVTALLASEAENQAAIVKGREEIAKRNKAGEEADLNSVEAPKTELAKKAEKRRGGRTSDGYQIA